MYQEGEPDTKASTSSGEKMGSEEQSTHSPSSTSSDEQCEVSMLSTSPSLSSVNEATGKLMRADM